jgi:hypothetical protein
MTNGGKARPVEGTGLGLAIVARLIRMQNGTLEVSSDEGEGSCFSFTLPYEFSKQEVLRDDKDTETVSVASKDVPIVNHQLRILAAEVPLFSCHHSNLILIIIM